MSLELPVFQPLPSPEEQPHVVEVAFKGMRRGFFHTTDASLHVGDPVLVEVERGRDLGRVRSLGGVARSKCGSEPGFPILRRADPDELKQLAVLRVDEERVRRTTRQMVEQQTLHMKVTDAEWQWDRNKLIVYFTAERRVDFRQLVRELARTFRTRIELKQIGVRDEAAQLGGVGRCGRELCCSTWLREIKPISLQLAKDQSLSLNPQQISGTCGRLMCCLTYEHDAYLAARKRFPREGKNIRTSVGTERVVGIDIWRNLVTLQDEQRQRRVVELEALRAEMAAAPPRRPAPARSRGAGEARAAHPGAVTAAAAAAAQQHPAAETRVTAGRFYITTAIDYANGDPHQGHAFEKIGADAIARYHRLLGEEVRFCMGMDEHGQKVAQAAAAREVDPQALVDELAARFAATWEKLEISNDRWIRTTDAHHKRGVTALIERALERSTDDFYEKSYEGWYCVGCELFKREAEIVDGHCVLHPTRELQWTEERNWFFRLSGYQKFLDDHFRANPGFLLPEARRNEMLALLESGLEDISITRARLSWAIPFPRPTGDGVAQGTWVWFDALPNYLTDTGFPDAGFEAWWPAQLHVVGKDITRLHSIIWPAMLQSAGLPLPERVWGHGFVMLGGERFSKSSGVGLDLNEAIDRFGPDAFRYFLLREVPWDADGNFSWERFAERYTAELANGLGNLASRTLSMVDKYRGGTVPAAADTALDRPLDAALARYRAAMDANLLHEGAAAAFAVVDAANAFVAEKAPWKLAKDEASAAELDAVLASLVRAVALSAVLLSPFMPAKMAELWGRLGAGADLPLLDDLAGLRAGGWQVTAGAVLFPRPESATA